MLKTIRTNPFRSYTLSVETLLIKGASHTKSNVGKIGGGAAAGAIIGAIAGGGKGAAIGAGVGAAAGTAVAAATGKREAVVEPEAVLTWQVASQSASTSGSSDDRQRSMRSYDDEDRSLAHARGVGDRNEEMHYNGAPPEFTRRDRRIIRGCFGENRTNLPPGLAKRERLPPGLERQLQRDGTLPPGLQKRVQPLPEVCEIRLARLPQDWARVALSGRIILLDPNKRIMDLFFLEADD